MLDKILLGYIQFVAYCRRHVKITLRDKLPSEIIFLIDEVSNCPHSSETTIFFYKYFIVRYGIHGNYNQSFGINI